MKWQPNTIYEYQDMDGVLRIKTNNSATTIQVISDSRFVRQTPGVETPIGHWYINVFKPIIKKQYLPDWM